MYMDDGEDDLHAYYASQASYGSDKHHKLLTSYGYTQDPSLSSNDTRTYTRPDKTIVSYKGTNPFSLKDLNADKDIGLGRHRSNREFKAASDTAKRAKEKYRNKIITTGHSLGGTKAIESANDVGGRAIAFNPGTGLRGLDTGSHKVYIHEKDLIASRVKGSNVTKVKGGSRFTPIKSHSIDTFEDTIQKRSAGRGTARGVYKKQRMR